MITIQKEILTIDYETGLIEIRLSNGWIIKQRFDWYVDYDGLQVEYNTDAMEIIRADHIEECTNEELEALDACIWDISDLQTEILTSAEYTEAVKDYKASLDKYAYYGVSERDFY
ncbi:MAG: hypothetical protein ACTTH7_09080 [Treponema sp.]